MEGYKWMQNGGDWVRIHNIVLEVGQKSNKYSRRYTKCTTRDVG